MENQEQGQVDPGSGLVSGRLVWSGAIRVDTGVCIHHSRV